MINIFSTGASQGGSPNILPYLPQPRRALPALIILLLLAASPAMAWQVVTFARVPARTSAITVIDGAIWCGYNRADTTIKVIDPADGSVTASIPAPEASCLGLAYRNGLIWFLGREHLYSLNRQGAVTATLNLPFQNMKGLAVFGAGLWTVEEGEGDAHLTQFSPQDGLLQRVAINVYEPGGLSWDGSNFWITEPGGGFIHQLDSTGRTIEIYPTPAYSPRGVAQSNGQFYLIDSGDEDAGDVLYTMSLAAEASPRLMTSATLHQFNMVYARGSLLWNLGLFNVGTSNLTVTAVSRSRIDTVFSLGSVQLPITIRPGQLSIVRVNFNPPDYGVYRDTVTIVSDDPQDDTIRVVLEGIGVYNDRFLAINPTPINFDTVRAEPLRDGSRHLDVKFINKGAYELTVTDVHNSVPDIFSVSELELPMLIQPADTFMCRIWFTPHRQLQYIDTLIVQSNGLEPWLETVLVGRGDDREVGAGAVLWEKAITANQNGSGAIAVHADMNRDGVREVVAVSADGRVLCINGFASGRADVLWEQKFEGAAFTPAGIRSSGTLEAGISLGGNPSGDVVFGSGAPDGAVYALNGSTGELRWRWDANGANAGDRIDRIIASADFEGDGAYDPVVMATDGSGRGAIVRLEGNTGSVVWKRYIDDGEFLEVSSDMNGDGLSEYVLGGGESVTVYSGADGSIIHSLTGLGEITALQPLGRVVENNSPVILIGLATGGVKAIEVIHGNEIWHLSQSPNAGEFVSVKFIRYHRSVNGSQLAIGDEDGRIAVVDELSNGHVQYDIPANGNLTSLQWATPDERDYHFNLLAGYSSGLVVGFLGNDSLWSWLAPEVAGEGQPSIMNILSFEDVDFGGSRDIIALTSDGFVRCLSSGGNLSVRQTTSPVPTEMGLALYPNPFNGFAILKVNLPAASPLAVEVFDVLGRNIARRTFGMQSAGQVEIGFQNLEGVSAGGTLLFRVETKFGSSIISGQYVK